MLLQDYINYWAGIVQQHAKIKQFYRLNFEEYNDAIRENAEYPILCLSDYKGDILLKSGGTAALDIQSGSILILDRFELQDYDDEVQKLNDLKAYGLGIFAKIMDGINIESCPKILLEIEPNSIKYELTDYITEHVKGWLFDFKFVEKADDYFVNPNHWL